MRKKVVRAVGDEGGSMKLPKSAQKGNYNVSGFCV